MRYPPSPYAPKPHNALTYPVTSRNFSAMSELRARAVRINGLKGGRPKGYQPPKFVLDTESVIDEVASKILAGKPITCVAPTASGVIKSDDRKRMTAILGTTLEEFNTRMGEKLAILSDKIVKRIEEKIDDDKFKTGELGFIFSVTEDKRRALDVRSQLGAAQVNIQVNHYGDRSREEIMADLNIIKKPIDV